MNIKIIVAGKPALTYAKSSIEDYLKRLTRYGQYELIVIKSGTSDDVSERLLERSHGCFLRKWNLLNSESTTKLVSYNLL